ncbi:hypothetical protein [Pseudogemmobacter sp. W21_MBD1_M6]|uniref:hypothetical protein n=1 Tax=Pseudogemmobacter sp. W21_MBD1_M6 TaxID=3240271 RepID=UPI003F998296
MDQKKTLCIYLDDGMKERAETGQHNFMKRIRAAFETQGFSVGYSLNTVENRLRSASDQGYSLFHMDDPFHPRALTTRRAYFYPFWRIESSAKRWEWVVAHAAFDAAAINRKQAAQFANFWKKRLFNDGPDRATQDGFVYIPLQGRVLDHRSFQVCSPLDMIKATLKHDVARKVIVTFHPNEVYSGAERQAVQKLADTTPRLRVIEGQMAELLRGCDYVVTQNSSVALAGFFHHKPAILFGQIDFHHIAANVGRTGVEAAFAQVTEIKPDYDRYLFWFLKKMSINAGNPDAEAQILTMVQNRGWVV